MTAFIHLATSDNSHDRIVGRAGFDRANAILTQDAGQQG